MVNKSLRVAFQTPTPNPSAVLDAVSPGRCSLDNALVRLHEQHLQATCRRNENCTTGMRAAPLARARLPSSPAPLSPSPLEHPGHGAGRGDSGMPWAPRIFSDRLKRLLKASWPRRQNRNQNPEATSGQRDVSKPTTSCNSLRNR